MLAVIQHRVHDTTNLSDTNWLLVIKLSQLSNIWQNNCGGCPMLGGGCVNITKSKCIQYVSKNVNVRVRKS